MKIIFLSTLILAASLTGIAMAAEVPDGFVLIKDGTFQMGSPANENWRSDDEAQHEVTVSDFFMKTHEVTQAEYNSIMGTNPSTFQGADLPVENMSWLEAVAFCNAKSVRENLTPVYEIHGESVTWDRSANGYRLPTEAEWEYACRAGTTTPFNLDHAVSAEEANYYGHYPYEIEGNYFHTERLQTQPGRYRGETVPVGSFKPNAFGLFDMHGNVSEWVWDWYGEYDAKKTTLDPTGPETGTLRVYRGGGWNDFGKNLRSAYRGTLKQDSRSFNLGIRLVRNAAALSGVIGSASLAKVNETNNSKKVLIVFYSWSGNTRGVAQEIYRQLGAAKADLLELELVTPYSSDYNTVLDEAQRDQRAQARPKLANYVKNISQYDTILVGYPNWWASIPMPIASFLDEHDLSGKRIIPFCSHGGGRFGQSITAIAKLEPNAVIGTGLSVHYSGGSRLSQDVTKWLADNGIK